MDGRMDGKRAMRAAHWRAQVSRWRNSGETRAAYCAAHGLSVSTLGYWIRRLREHCDAPDAGRLTLVAARVMTMPVGPSTAGAELTLRSPSGWALTFDSRPPAAWLRELLAAEGAENDRI